MFLIGGEKQSHRKGLYQCKPCRKSFSVTVGTPLERLRVPLSTWMRAAREFSADDTRRAHNARRGDNLVPLGELAQEIRVTYRTVLRMRAIVERAARKYRGHKNSFGAWPRSLMIHKQRETRADHSGLWGARGHSIGKREGTACIGPHRSRYLGYSSPLPGKLSHANAAQLLCERIPDQPLSH